MEKIDIAKLLVDCPKGMELDSPMWDGVTLDGVDINYDHYPIRLRTRSGLGISLTRYGQDTCHKDAKCVIFPKGETSWEGFTPPHQFKDGDVIVDEQGSIAIYKQVHKSYEEPCVDFHCRIYEGNKNLFHTNFIKGSLCHCGKIASVRFATAEEKEKLFDAIRANGYRWNDKTKTLEKLVNPKFKAGDNIKHTGGLKATVLDVDETHYKILSAIGVSFISISLQDEWELMPNKFDIDDLKPFDKVLVRYDSLEVWRIHLFEVFVKTHPYPFICMGYNNHFKQCIPYEGNEKLLGTTNDCEEFYKTWED